MNARRYSLNPCDYMFFALDRRMRSNGQPGQSSLVVLKLRGEIDPDRLRQAVARLFAVHPTIGASARIGRLWRLPYWIAAGEPTELARRACCFFDMRDRSDWPECGYAELERGYSAQVNPMESPHTRVDCLSGPDGETLVGIHFPHALMDAEGSRLLLDELNRMDESPDSAMPAGILPDDAQIDPLEGASLAERWRLFHRTLMSHRRFERVRRSGLCRVRPNAQVGFGLRLLRLDQPVVEGIEARARAIGPGGLGVVARYTALCLIRALHALYVERGVDQRAYLVALPIGCRSPGPRPVPGNYLTGAVLGARRECVGDIRFLAADLASQIEEYFANETPRSTWAALEVCGLFWSWPYSKLVGSPLLAQPVASGYSFSRDPSPGLHRFVGADLECYWVCGPVTAPPGWNPVIRAFPHCWTIAMTWVRGYVADALAASLMEKFQWALVEGPEAVG